MTKNRANFVASFIKEAENMDIMRKYPYLKDNLNNTLIDPKT